MKKKRFNPIREVVADMHIGGVRFDPQVLSALQAQKAGKEYRTTRSKNSATEFW